MDFNAELQGAIDRLKNDAASLRSSLKVREAAELEMELAKLMLSSSTLQPEFEVMSAETLNKVRRAIATGTNIQFTSYNVEKIIDAILGAGVVFREAK